MTNGTDVKQGDRVLYLVGGVEFPAIARAGAHVGVHPGTKLGGAYLTLTYLNASGQPVQVLNAPLLPAAATDADVEAVAEATVKALRQKTLGSTAVADEPDEARIAAEYRAVKATSGWRPFVDGEDVAKLKAYSAALERELNDAHTLQAQAAQTITALTHENEQLKAHAAATVGSTDAEKAAQDSQHAAEVAELKNQLSVVRSQLAAHVAGQEDGGDQQSEHAQPQGEQHS